MWLCGVSTQYRLGFALTLVALNLTIVVILVQRPPHPRACTKCTGHHLSLLHKGNDSGRRFRLRDQKRKVANGDANQEMPPAATLVPQQQGTRQGLVPPAGNKHQALVSANGVSTRTAQVLLNVQPVNVTSENGDFLFTYAFLDNGCTDTIVDRELSDQLNLEGTFEQIIKTVSGFQQPLLPCSGCQNHIRRTGEARELV